MQLRGDSTRDDRDDQLSLQDCSKTKWDRGYVTLPPVPEYKIALALVSVSGRESVGALSWLWAPLGAEKGVHCDRHGHEPRGEARAQARQLRRQCTERRARDHRERTVRAVRAVRREMWAGCWAGCHLLSRFVSCSSDPGAFRSSWALKEVGEPIVL